MEKQQQRWFDRFKGPHVFEFSYWRCQKGKCFCGQPKDSPVHIEEPA